MFIKSIELDGFKSYGNRVEISGFDEEFNAITGLNGTGKSNILDAICFVLGITNLSNVRAGSLQELIYKHGQAGITKATVSIKFDNSDKKQCPIGYENHDEITVTRQVVMGGKNKYLINGINVQNKRVHDMFCSVQLNVNNPHFLIMQGRITKVLNMKPPEILSMVEEAAGTRMYESKKQIALQTIEKKDAKLKELNYIIKEDITPKLQRLHDERSQFQEYQKVVRELENLTRLHIAQKYVAAEESVKEAEKTLADVQDEIKTSHEQIEKNNSKSIELSTQISILSSKLYEESGCTLKKLEPELEELELLEAKAVEVYDDCRGTLAWLESQDKRLEQALAEDEAALKAKKDALDKVSSVAKSLREASLRTRAALKQAQDHFVNASSGLENGSESLQDLLIAAITQASDASTRIALNMMEKKNAENKLLALEKEFAMKSSQYQKDKDNIVKRQAEVDELKSEWSQMNFNPERESELKKSVRSLQYAVRDQRDNMERLNAQLRRCDFEYQMPQADFDPKRVCGTFASLFDVCDPIYCTALAIIAGARLYNVVVDNDETSRVLLQRGKLQARTTVVPLNRINGSVMDRGIVELAQQVGGGPEKVQLALDLISYESHLRPAMAWVFGGILVCRDMDSAKKVTFNPKIQRRCVTIAGDTFDPSGTLTGGALGYGSSVLLQLAERKQTKKELIANEAQLTRESAELNAMQHVAEKYTDTKHKFDMMSHELEMLKHRLAITSTALLDEDIKKLRARVEELTAALDRDIVIKKQALARVAELELKVKDLDGHRDRQYEKAAEMLKQAQKEAEHHGDLWEEREHEFTMLELQVQALEATVLDSKQQLDKNNTAIQEAKEEMQMAIVAQERAKAAVKQLESEIKRHRDEIKSKNTHIAQLTTDREHLTQDTSDIELKIKELECRARNLQIDATKYANELMLLEKEHSWIKTERPFFGAAGGMFDFTGRQPNVTAQRIDQLTERKEKLSRGLNTRAHTLLTMEEDQYQDMMRKKAIVEADRAKLVQVMAELDEKKRYTLLNACDQVNKDFGSIFSTLLPGAQAKLEPSAGLTVLDGLEVKVGFNNTWKESLGELSGGQRSLVALSLVLAMLLFKPAPLYILDEVDAALDLSHTQNIGAMLKDHFKHSQFIIVSLKDGMFNNANVLFRTSFVDGMSSVQRTVNHKRARPTTSVHEKQQAR